jgi:hypothetical protein
MNINISFINLVNNLLPYHKRTEKRFAFLRVFANKADKMMKFLKDFRSEALMLAYTNCQRFRLEKHLNDVFDKVQRRIIIKEVDDIGTIIGLESETDYILTGLESETDHYNIFGFLSEQEYLTNQIKVIVPSGINEDMVLEDINKYKLAGIKVIISN